MGTLFKIIGLLISLVIAAVFIYAGVLKLYDPAQFYADIENYQVVHGSLAVVTAYILPPLEILAALALLSARWRAAGLLLLAGLTSLFTVLIASAWWRGLDINCGCFGGEPGATASYLWMIGRDVLILLGLMLVYGLNNYKIHSEIKTQSSF